MKVSQELAKLNFHKSRAQCRSKWTQLQEKYKIALKTRNKSSFPFYNEIEETVKAIEESQVADDFSDNSDVHESDEDQINDFELPENVEHEERECWTKHETRRFLSLYLEHRNFKDYRKTPKQFWLDISEKLSDEGILKTPEKCSNKWKNLLRTYRKVAAMPTRAAVEVFPYYLAVKKILNFKNKNLEDYFGKKQKNVCVL